MGVACMGPSNLCPTHKLYSIPNKEALVVDWAAVGTRALAFQVL
uniref:Keratinocyte proline-rich protein-like isoform X3 n=1 Tax=Rhizophora mucronata TaxID=61149 RepID=A0A2P2M838_RHIMU